MINHRLGLIFVHIQKTGGNSVRAALDQPADPPEKHFDAVELQALYGEDAWSKYFKFAIVRNPWARLVSWWSMIDGHRAEFENGRKFNAFQTMVLTRAKTFADFVALDEELDDVDGVKSVKKNQIEYLSDQSGRVIIDFVGRFERLQQDMDFILESAGHQPRALPKLNLSKHGSYTDYYTPALADFVGRRFKRDIEYFGYSYGETSGQD